MQENVLQNVPPLVIQQLIEVSVVQHVAVLLTQIIQQVNRLADKKLQKYYQPVNQTKCSQSKIKIKIN
jgi:hypothetical protein